MLFVAWESAHISFRRDAASEKELILLNKNFFVRPRLNEKTNLFVFKKESRGIISHDLVFAEAAELP